MASTDMERFWSGEFDKGRDKDGSIPEGQPDERAFIEGTEEAWDMLLGEPKNNLTQREGDQ